MSAKISAIPRRAARRALLLAALAASLLGACATPSPVSVYFHPNADLSAFQRVAVMPLENLTSDRFAAERVREILTVELASMGAFQIVEAGEVNLAMRSNNIQALSDVGPDLIRKLGQDLNAQALVMGSVMEYRERQNGNLLIPEVAVTLRLVETETGVVVWSASDSRKGEDVWARLFGVGEESQAVSVRELLRDLIDTLFA
jgi:curli biogenesis system outer membrane secretion channel CsgG